MVAVIEVELGRGVEQVGLKPALAERAVAVEERRFRLPGLGARVGLDAMGEVVGERFFDFTMDARSLSYVGVWGAGGSL
jgi:hypothetical protein